MNLNTDLIADALRDSFNVVNVDVNNKEPTLEQIQLYTGDSTFLPGVVYVAEGGKLTKKPFFEGFCTIVSIGPADKSYLASGCDYIEIEKGESESEVMNCLQSACKKYYSWFLDMYEALSNKAGIQALLDLTLPLLENPIYLHDKNYQFIAYAEIPGMPGGSDIFRIKENKGRFSMEDINILKNTPYFEKTFETTTPTFHIDTGECSYIYDNVRIKNEYWGRVFVDERVRNFKNGDYAIIGILRSMIEKALAGRNISPGKTYRFLEEKIVSMLEGKSVDMAELFDEMRLKGWDKADSFFCFHMQMKEVDLLLNTMINTCESIESKLSDCLTFPYKDGVIGIVLIDSRSKTLERIRKALHEFELNVGVSLMFDRMGDFPLYYKQAGIALKYGIKENSPEWMHKFEDHCFSYMLDCCTEELPPDMLFPPALHKLIDHDRKKSTSYVETLRAYLENDMKPAKAMKALYIQRSTFLYRLDRINEMIGLDLENERIKTHFLLSFQLMDKLNAASAKPANT